MAIGTQGPSDLELFIQKVRAELIKRPFLWLISTNFINGFLLNLFL